MGDDYSWYRSFNDFMEEVKRNKANKGDPFHPNRLSKGEKHRNRSRRHVPKGPTK